METIEVADHKPWEYDKLSWPEVGEAAKAGRVIVLPVGTTEQHGPHLPLDVDTYLCARVCEGAAALVPDEVLVMPPLPYGFNWHHIDFPGTIGIAWDTYVHFLLDIVKSVTHHGFRKVLIVNGHGSNRILVEIAARQATMDNPAAKPSAGCESLPRAGSLTPTRSRPRSISTFGRKACGATRSRLRTTCCRRTSGGRTSKWGRASA
jgi:hypothetical protein